MKQRTKPAGARKLLDLKAWLEAPFSLFTVSQFFSFVALYIPFFYVQLYALQKTSVRGELLVYLLTLLNGASLFGRALPGLIADRIGPMNVLIPCMATAGAILFAWVGVIDEAGTVIFCLLYGFFSGTFVSLGSTIIFTLCPSPSMMGVRSGMVFMPIGIGLLVGNPIAGALLDGSWISL